MERIELAEGIWLEVGKDGEVAWSAPYANSFKAKTMVGFAANAHLVRDTFRKMLDDAWQNGHMDGYKEAEADARAGNEDEFAAIQGVVEELRAELEELAADAKEHVQELVTRVRFLLDHFGLWSEDEVFTFPDGDTWHRQDG